MKMVAVQCIKFLRLKRRLRLPSWQVVGLLESVWLFTQSNAPAGDIGKHSDEDIAAHIEWDGDAEQLVKDLVECGWLDRHETHRLVVHDWHEHAPNYVKGNMAKHGKGFVTVESMNSAREAPREVAKDTPRDGAVAACSTPVSTHHPRVGLGRVAETDRECVAQPHVTTTEDRSDDVPLEGTAPKSREPYSHDFEQFWNIYPTYRRRDKGNAWKAWLKALKIVTAEELIEKAEAYAASPVGRGEFSKLPASWLNARGWEDDPTAWGSAPEHRPRIPTIEELANYNPNG